MEKIPNNKEEPSKPITEKLVGLSNQITNLVDGETIRIGSSIFSQDSGHTELVTDFSNIENFYKTLADNAKNITAEDNLPQIKEWLDQLDLKQDIDPKLFGKLYTFEKVYEKMLAHKGDVDELEIKFARKKAYSENDAKLNLSAVVEGKFQMCAEIAALTQYYLQQQEVDSKYINGALASDEQIDNEYFYSEPHSFLVINHDGNEYIYDPSKPISANIGRMPAIFTTEVDFDELLHGDSIKLAAAQNILSGNKSYYGIYDSYQMRKEKNIV